MASTKCYNWNARANNVSIASPEFDQPCPAGGGCCNPGDTCVGTFMCKHKEKATDPNRPDYYIGACTDPTFSSSACVKWCYEFVRTGVVWNSTSDRWACCGTVGPSNNLTTTCATPTNVTFALVAPELLPIIGIAGGPAAASSASSASASSTASSSTGASTSTPTPNDSEGGLSTGAKAGLGVGIAVAVAIIAAVLAFLILRRRRERRSRNSSSFAPAETQAMKKDSYFASSKRDRPPSYPPGRHDGSRISGSLMSETVHEIGGDTIIHSELPSNRYNKRAELP